MRLFPALQSIHCREQGIPVAAVPLPIRRRAVQAREVVAADTEDAVIILKDKGANAIRPFAFI